MTNAKRLIGALCGLWVAAGAMAARAEPAATPAAYAPRAEETCMRCHDKAPVTDILQTPHATKGDPHSPFAQHGCESCHGASPQHLATPPQGQKRAPPTVVFVGPNASPVEARNGVCLTCHQSGLRMHWQGSQHASNEIACSNCHNPHAAKDPVLVKTSQPQVCFTCHSEQRADSFKYSHHPIREAKVICSDCHNPHGSPGPKLLKEVNVNQTCYNCHAEKRGPFLWEHQPVREDCTNCHTPHGSTQARLLKERLPYLCENCHGAGGHNGAPFAGQNLPGAITAQAKSNTGTNASPNFIPNGVIVVPQFQINARGCANCHSQVHGSNSPAGLYFTR